MWVSLPAVSKKGEALDSHLINLSNVLYFREWFENKPITDSYKGKSVAYVTGGKEVVIDLPLHQVTEIVLKIGQPEKHRHNSMLERAEETNKKTA